MKVMKDNEIDCFNIKGGALNDLRHFIFMHILHELTCILLVAFDGTLN
jgi:hypothetical protein